MYSNSYTQGRFSYFITVAETGNITKAAQALRVSQPSLSQYLTRLERDLGVKLLDRSTTPIALTEAGTIYLEYVRSVLAMEKQLKIDLNHVKHGKDQILTLGIPSQLIPLIFESCVQNFIDQHPNIDVKIMEGTSVTTKKLLLDGHLDIAFFHTTERTEPLFTRRIMQEEDLLLATSIDNPIVKGKKTLDNEKIFQLEESDIPLINVMQLISLGEGYYLHRLIMDYLHQLGVSPKNMITVPNVRAISNYVSKAAYNGISILPNFMTSLLLDTANFAYIKPVGVRIPTWYLTMNAPANQNLSKCAQLFWKSVPAKIDLR